MPASTIAGVIRKALSVVVLAVELARVRVNCTIGICPCPVAAKTVEMPRGHLDDSQGA